MVIDKKLFGIIFILYSAIFIYRGWPINMHEELVFKGIFFVYSWHLIYAYIYNKTMFIQGASRTGFKDLIRVVGVIFGVFILLIFQYQGINFYAD